MRTLRQVQGYHYWQLIKVRFRLIMPVLISLMLTVGYQVTDSNYPHAIAQFFAAPTAVELAHGEITFPVFWLGYFCFPLIIVNNSFQQLWQAHAVQLRGFQFSKLSFGRLNLQLLGLTALAIDGLTIVTLWLTQSWWSKVAFSVGPIKGASAWALWAAILFLELLLLLMVQQLCNIVSPAIGLIIPVVLLVLTIYWPNPQNPLGLAIYSRLPALQPASVLWLLGCLVLLIGGYLISYRYLENH
ncbi:hypothetical protein [Lactiplantibacillus xiangfangensis]|uniref:Uncharacterized protein n=1 Tax=Lactiplantibacillus xiangfangensis TaxID=942150 RepID=A0A0R2MAW3_9LACO|nr:hypothetical protein [Lactiplantibacillus xiangfangensis]KRO10927.1 hypothetical protein IV64_GL002620 [Lactiplantibacillus xiangfangensis]